MAEPFISQISAFGLGFTIEGWTQCQGQLLSVGQNQALFSLILNIYGGDGRVSMGVPNLAGRTVLHSGTGPGLSNRNLGDQHVSRTWALNHLEMPSHDHLIAQKAKPSSGASRDPAPGFVTAIPEGSFGGTPVIADWYASASNLTDLSSYGSPATSTEGASSPISTMSPFQVVSYQMALLGTYPPRS
ncbi:phage tail protein [Pseudovibrio sp. SPO723]|uniref:phage tail protein n=1 Tax=Nesiotobacter zosterae TaxID=392721 RepID=UPI0029C37255|nr:tail fiber protein [Pseudovibrio sp. SPO723]MDX5594305.1 tail fiber protein [Pseudovibrio sp. SPO723]